MTASVTSEHAVRGASTQSWAAVSTAASPDTSQPTAPLSAVTPAIAVPWIAPLTGPQPATASLAAGASPTEQVASAVITVGQSPTGTGHVTLHLQPADLGSVQVRIERSSEGITRISITAEKADTLDLLQRSQGQLHQTLDTAGMSVAGREISFHTAPMTPSASTPSMDTGLGGGDLSQQAQSNFGQASGQAGDGSGRPAYSGVLNTGNDQGRIPSILAPEMLASSVRHRAGLDILA